MHEAKHTYGVGENAVVTPCYGVNARLEKPIWGCEYVMLSFDEGKRFSGFEFFRGSDEEKLSISDCSKKVREIVAELKRNFREDFRLVATGGFARWALKDAGMDFTVDPTLTLYGAGLICSKAL